MAASGDGYDYGAYCGLYCGACAILLANERGAMEELLANEKAAAYTAEQLTCRGCRADVVACFCVDCEMRLCAGGHMRRGRRGTWPRFRKHPGSHSWVAFRVIPSGSGTRSVHARVTLGLCEQDQRPQLKSAWIGLRKP